MPYFLDVQFLISTYGLIGIFIIIFLESGIFPPLPGDSLLFAAGLYAAVGGFNIHTLTIIVFVASFLGIISGYYVGTHIQKLERYSFFKKILKQKYIDQAHIFFEKHGKYAIILSRFVPIVRTFIPITAGIAKMNYSNFLKYSLVGSAIWSLSLLYGGYFLGKIFPEIENYFTLVIVLIIILSLLPGVYHLLKNRRQISPEKDQTT